MESVCKVFRMRSVGILLLSMLLFVTAGVTAQGDMNVIIHSVLVDPIPGRLAHQVTLYVSVLEANGAPIRDLKDDNFSVMQDSQIVNYDLNEVGEEPVSIVLALDTSGSMSGAPMEAAKRAATLLVDRIGPDDRVALVSFNKEVKVLSDFNSSTDSVRSNIKGLMTVPNSGTCWFDAAYKSVELANLLPPGRRAVILLTDGRDELLDGSVCSAYTVDDVLELAASSISRVPVYTVGLGNSIDKNQLIRLSNLTGGEFIESPAATQLESVFSTLSDQLRYQYKIQYVSESAPGKHMLLVKANIGGLADQDTQEFVLPEVPVIISIKEPLPGAKVDDTLHVAVSISGQVDQVAAVQYSVDTRQYEPVAAPPFEMDLILKDLPEGNLQLRAAALDKNGVELSSSAIQINWQPAAVPTFTEPTALPSPTVVPTPAGPGEPQGVGTILKENMAVFASAGIALLIIIALIVFMVQRQKKSQKALEGSSGESDFGDATIDFSVSNTTPIAVIKVLNSDDPLRIGESIKIFNNQTVIGRSERTDVSFTKDKSASRQHVMITCNDGTFTLGEVATIDETTGLRKWPTYGTYIDDVRVQEGETVPLNPGAEIRLGNRLRLRFDPVEAVKEDMMEVTYDGLSGVSDDTSTIEV